MTGNKIENIEINKKNKMQCGKIKIKRKNTTPSPLIWVSNQSLPSFRF